MHSVVMIQPNTWIVFVQCFDTESHKIALSGLSSIKSLSGKGIATIDVLAPDCTTPIGCAVFVVSSSATILLQVKGHVEVDAEIQRAKIN